MAVKVRQNQREATYFVTFTCHRWLPLFEETKLYDNLYNWFRILNEKEIKVIGYVFMRNAARPNHLHCLIYLPKDAPELYGNAKLRLSAMPKDLWHMRLSKGWKKKATRIY